MFVFSTSPMGAATRAPKLLSLLVWYAQTGMFVEEILEVVSFQELIEDDLSREFVESDRFGIIKRT